MGHATACLRVPAIVFSFTAWAAAADVADASQLLNRPVTEVRFDPAHQPLAAGQLDKILPLKPNTPVTLANIRTAIKRLYATGRYSYVEVDAEPQPAGVMLIFRTRDQWFVGPVEVDGKVRNPPNEGQLANAARLDLGQPFDDTAVEDAVRNIQQLFRRNGFFKAQVDPRMERDAEHQQVAFKFVVDPGDRARLIEPIIQGDPRMPRDKVASAAKYKGWFRWKPATNENVQGGLQRIRNRYQKDDRLTAKIDLDQMSYIPDGNRARPMIEVQGGPKVDIKTVGAKVSGRKLKRYVPVFDEGAVNRDLLVLGARNLRDYFQNQGYFEAEVNFENRTAGPDREEITYVVTPGERHKLVEVSVRGNHYFKTDDLRERMYLQPAGFLIMRHGRYSDGFLRRDQDAIKVLYQNNGFRDVQVRADTTDDYKGKQGDVAVTVTVEEGPQYFVSDFKISGIQKLNRDEVVPMLATLPGQPFSENNVALDRDFILNRYLAAGYPDAVFDWRMTPGPGPHQFQVQFFITEGEQRFVRDVLISGMRTTRWRLVNPNILLRPGEPLSWVEMGTMQRRLYNLGVFDKVDMAIQNPQGDTDSKYVLYHLEEGHRYSVAMGFGAEVARIGGSQSSLDNPAGATGFSPRASLDVSRLNLWGLGHSLNFKSKYSTLDRRASLNYSAPRYRNVEGRNISVTALYDNTRDVRTFTSRRLEGSAQISQQLSKASNLLFRYSYRDSRVDEGTLKIDPLLVPLLSQPARVGMFSTTFIQDRRDDPVDAHRGIYNTLDFGIASRPLASRKNFGRFLGRNSTYRTFGRGLVLASNTQLGILAGFSRPAGTDPFLYIPLPERFFGGGSTSHRGFPDNQAGPRDLVTGFPLGGNALLFHSTELRFPFLSDNIDGVLFQDMGNVYSTPGKISFRVSQRDVNDFDYMVHAVGFGVRYRTPVGPIRVDVAYSINPPSFFGFKGTHQQLLLNQGTRQLQNISHFQFFFSIGQAF